MTSKEMFTDKAKELFEEWLENSFEIDEKPIPSHSGFEEESVYASEHFNILPLSMQFGVIEDFMLSLGYYIESYYVSDTRSNIITATNPKRNESVSVSYLDKNEARIDFVKVLNNLINNKDE